VWEIGGGILVGVSCCGIERALEAEEELSMSLELVKRREGRMRSFKAESVIFAEYIIFCPCQRGLFLEGDILRNRKERRNKKREQWSVEAF